MERKNYRIIALDMDGTLLTSDKTIAPDTVRDIRAASERGIHVVYCTGRAVPELKLYFDMVPMMRYAVCSTGALVYDRVENAALTAVRSDRNWLLRWRRLQNGIARCRISSRTTRPLLPQTM